MMSIRKTYRVLFASLGNQAYIYISDFEADSIQGVLTGSLYGYATNPLNPNGKAEFCEILGSKFVTTGAEDNTAAIADVGDHGLSAVKTPLLVDLDQHARQAQAHMIQQLRQDQSQASGGSRQPSQLVIPSQDGNEGNERSPRSARLSPLTCTADLSAEDFSVIQQLLLEDQLDLLECQKEDSRCSSRCSPQAGPSGTSSQGGAGCSSMVDPRRADMRQGGEGCSTTTAAPRRADGNDLFYFADMRQVLETQVPDRQQGVLDEGEEPVQEVNLNSDAKILRMLGTKFIEKNGFFYFGGRTWIAADRLVVVVQETMTQNLPKPCEALYVQLFIALYGVAKMLNIYFDPSKVPKNSSSSVIIFDNLDRRPPYGATEILCSLLSIQMSTEKDLKMALSAQCRTLRKDFGNRIAAIIDENAKKPEPLPDEELLLSTQRVAGRWIFAKNRNLL